MLRQLARLCHPVPAAGGGAMALAVYAKVDGTMLVAQDAGLEGVACIDDAARAVELLCDLYQETKLPWVYDWAKRLLTFVLWMEEGESGLWCNFIYDWDGTKNISGPTSFAGGDFWQARAAVALMKAAVCLDDETAYQAALRALQHIKSSSVATDIRALHIVMGLTAAQRELHAEHRRLLTAWCEELCLLRRGPLLLNDVNEGGHPHLWGHIQEGVLADAGLLLQREDFITVAKESAAVMFFDIIEGSFALPTLEPYGVASTIYCMDRLSNATQDPTYATFAEKARQWFDGRNTARRPLYDREEGRILDGIIHNQLNPDSGAESNIVGAQALFSEVVERAKKITALQQLPFEGFPSGVIAD